ncbi:unnamed protein product [Merluccius merluccius]
MEIRKDKNGGGGGGAAAAERAALLLNSFYLLQRRSAETHRVWTRSLHNEPDPVPAQKTGSGPCTENRTRSSTHRTGPGPTVPQGLRSQGETGFVELSLADQIQLLKCCWLEVLMLGLMWRSVDHPGKLIFSPDLKLNREEGNCVEGIMEIFDMLLSATSRFRELNLQREEYVCLKAMILLNSNICTAAPETAEEVESRKRLLQLLDLVIDALVWAISKLGLSTQEQTLRLGHLTMLLSHIRHISNKGMDHLSTMKKKNVVFVYDLLLEMLDANTSSSASSSSSSSTGSHMTSSSPSSDGFCDQPTQLLDQPGSAGSAMNSSSPDQSSVLRHTQDRAPSLGGTQLQLQSAQRPPLAGCPAMEGDGYMHAGQWLVGEAVEAPPLGAEPDYSLGGVLHMETI